MKRTASLILVFLSAALLIGCDGDGGAEPTASPSTGVTSTVVAASPAPPSPTVAPRELTFRLQPPTPAAPVAGQTFTMTVRAEGAANLGAYQLSPIYDSAVLELLSMQDGGFLGSTGRPPSCNTEGAPSAQATFYCLTIGPQPAGPSGDGDLVLLEFRALQAGTTQVTVERASASMPDATDLPVLVEPVSVVVAP